jgi:FAD binding domain
MKILTKNQCEFAVRSGGHNANTGANSINDGVSIDLSTLSNTTLAPDRGHISLGSGVTWGQAYDYVSDSGIGFTGGICEDVGVGGVSLGGGQSLFQPKRGWVIDNIVNYEVVLASGDIVNANQTSYPDLFKALKGGNTNFGIVTKVDIAAFEFDQLWAGEVFVALEGPFGINIGSSREDVLNQMSRAITNFTANNHEDVDTAVQLMTVYLSHNMGHLINAAFGNTVDREEPESLQPFLDMPNQVPFMTHSGHTKLNDFVHKVSEFQAKGYR